MDPCAYCQTQGRRLCLNRDPRCANYTNNPSQDAPKYPEYNPRPHTFGAEAPPGVGFSSKDRVPTPSEQGRASADPAVRRAAFDAWRSEFNREARERDERRRQYYAQKQRNQNTAGPGPASQYGATAPSDHNQASPQPFKWVTVSFPNGRESRREAADQNVASQHGGTMQQEPAQSTQARVGSASSQGLQRQRDGRSGTQDSYGAGMRGSYRSGTQESFAGTAEQWPAAPYGAEERLSAQPQFGQTEGFATEPVGFVPGTNYAPTRLFTPPIPGDLDRRWAQDEAHQPGTPGSAADESGNADSRGSGTRSRSSTRTGGRKKRNADSNDGSRPGR